MARRRRLLATGIALAAVLAGGCASTTAHRPRTGSSATTPPTRSAVPTRDPAPTPAFTARAAPVSAADLGASYHPGCPVPPTDLRRIDLSFWGFDGRAHAGSLVVNRRVVAAVTTAFRTLYDNKFPIRHIEPVSRYGGSDDASMAADNTSAFNCRYAVAPGPPHWSAHAYGEAVDVNPVENPYLEGERVLPPSGADYVDRSEVRPGMAVPGGPLWQAFHAVGWRWGGRWASPDYQHFSATGG